MPSGGIPFQTKAGDTLVFFYDFDALVQAEDAADKSIQEILSALSSGTPRLGVLRALIWAGLRGNQPDISLAEVSELILAEGEGLGTAMAKSLTAAMPRLKPGGEGEGNPRRPVAKARAAGTSTRSSRAGARKG